MAINRRELLASLGAGLGLMALHPAARLLAATADLAARNNLNVLWIGVDDLRCALGCYGHDEIHSPHIDSLARRGVMFRNAHVQQAVCAASRASFLTGCRPDTTTVDYPYNKFFTGEFLPEHPTLPKYFFDNGYHTRWGGKIHHGGPLDLRALSGPQMVTPSDDPWWQHYALPENRAIAVKAREDKSIKPPSYEMADVPDDAYADGRLADGTVLAIRAAAAQDKPFFLTPGFVKPHLPFCAPAKYWNLYDRDAIRPARSNQPPLGAPTYAPATYELPTYAGSYGSAANPIPDDLATTLRHGYYACTSYIDAQVGKLLAELDDLRLWDKTIVVFWSDHGFHLGDNGAWGKHMNYEWSTRSPLIFYAPGMAGNGTPCDALVEYVDMYPTLCELTGLPLPAYLEGTSMVPLLHTPGRNWKSAAFSQYPRGGGLEGFAIRTQRHRYVEWRRGEQVEARELYDHQSDPDESRNIADAQPETVRDLSAQLAAGWRAALPQ